MVRGLSFLLFLSAVLLSCLSAVAQDLATAEQVLEATYQRYAAIQDYQDKWTMTIETPASKTTMDIEFACHRPDRVLWSVGGPQGAGAACDGKTSWKWLAILQEYTEEPAAGDIWDLALDTTVAAGGQVWTGAPDVVLLSGRSLTKEPKRAQLGPAETLDGQGMYVILLPGEEFAGVTPTKIELLIGKTDLLAHQWRIEMTLPAQGQGQGRMSIKILGLAADIKINEPIPEAKFAFAPAAGMKRVDELHARSEEEPLETPVVVGRPAVSFALKNLSGKTVNLSDFRGKPVLIDFWATWCGPCQEELAELERIHQVTKDQDLVLLAINLGDEKIDITRFVKRNHLTMSVLLDSKGFDGKQGKAYNIEAIPFLVFVDKRGIVSNVREGTQSLQWLRTELAKLGIEVPHSLPKSASDLADECQRDALKAYLLGHDEEAIRLVKTAAELEPYSPDRLFSLLDLYLVMDRLTDAEEAAKQIVAMDTTDAELESNIAYTYLERKKGFDPALVHAEQAVKLDPKSVNGWYLAGWALLEKGKTDQAVTKLKKAQALDEENGTILYRLGQALEKQNKKDEALACYRKAAKQENLEAKQTAERLAAELKAAPKRETKEAPKRN